MGFAAPTFWKDLMLDNFMRLIEKSGWPARSKIWSEPKCALSAHFVLEYILMTAYQRGGLPKGFFNTPKVVVDIGAGSLVSHAQTRRLDVHNHIAPLDDLRC